MCQHTPNTTEYQRKTHLKTQTPPKCHESGRSSPRGGWFEGIHRLPVTPTALLGLLSPLTAALLGHLAVSEVLSPAQLLGLALALTAMTAGQLAPPSSRFSCG